MTEARSSTAGRTLTRARSWQEMNAQIRAQLERQTGEGVEAWNARIRAGSGLSDEASLRAWLADQGITGYPAMLLVHETFGYPGYLQADADELIEGQYRDRPGLRPTYDAVIAALPSIGQVEIQARKTYVALISPKRTFASIQATTRTRVDIGLRLDGVPAAELAAAGPRLEPAKSIGQSSMTHKLGLASPADLDADALAWLRRAYEANL